MAAGGHFFTDVFFSGVFTYLIIWLVHGLLYRWPATRIGDRTVERALERLAEPGHRAVAKLFARQRAAPDLWARNLLPISVTAASSP